MVTRERIKFIVMSSHDFILLLIQIPCAVFGWWAGAKIAHWQNNREWKRDHKSWVKEKLENAKKWQR